MDGDTRCYRVRSVIEHPRPANTRTIATMSSSSNGILRNEWHMHRPVAAISVSCKWYFARERVVIAGVIVVQM
jgi:hypothetical protein